MDIQTFEMEPRHARELWLTYCKGLRTKRSIQNRKEDEALKSMYRQLAQGKRILMMSQVLRAAGVDENGCPRIGIAPASAQTLYFDGRGSYSTGSEWVFSGHRESRDRKKQLTYYLPNGLIPEGKTTWNHGAQAAVPHIPMHLRPVNIANHWILWEPNWQRQLPDPDPMLLKRVGDDIFAIMAVWDMSPFERAVLEGRL